IRRLLVVLVAVGLVAGTLAVLRSGLFAVDRIDVAGDSQTDPAALAESAGLELGMPLIEVDLDAVVAAVQADPRVVSAEVGRRWPRGVEITVVERFPVAWVDQGGGWQHMAADGVVLAAGDPGPEA